MKEVYQEQIRKYNAAKKAGAQLPCPKCGKMTLDGAHDLTSRRADIEICESCALVAEAVEDIRARKAPKLYPTPASEEYKDFWLSHWWLMKSGAFAG